MHPEADGSASTERRRGAARRDGDRLKHQSCREGKNITSRIFSPQPSSKNPLAGSWSPQLPIPHGGHSPLQIEMETPRHHLPSTRTGLGAEPGCPSAQRAKAVLHADSTPLLLGQMLAGKGKNKSPATTRACLRDSKCAGQTWAMGLWCRALVRGASPGWPEQPVTRAPRLARGLGGDNSLENM